MAGGAGSSAGCPSWLQLRANAVTVRVRAKPGSSRRGVIRAEADAIVIGLNSAPDKGRANDELIEFLARAADVPRSAISIVRGGSARQKLVRIATGEPSAVSVRLAALETPVKSG